MDIYTRKVKNKVDEEDCNNLKKFSIVQDYHSFINGCVDGGFASIRKFRE